MRYWIVLSAVGVWCDAAFYHTFTGKRISPARFNETQRLNLVPFCAIEVRECDPNEPRRLDYSCNNLHYPSRGTTMTPYRRLLPPAFDANSNHRPSTSGAPLPLARAVRTAVMSDGRVASKKYTHMVPNGAVFITGDTTSVHDTANYVAVTRTCCLPGGDRDPRCIPVYVPEDDVHLRWSNVRCMNLTRAVTYQNLGCVPETLSPERINTSPPMLELSIIYGNDERGARGAMEGRGGRLRADSINGKDWPPTGSPVCIQNQAPRETRCHATPVPVTNGLIAPNVMSIWILRLHNAVARKLEALNPCWDDERLYREAKEICIALINQIWYYEMFPAILGYDYLLQKQAIFNTMTHINDYDPSLEPRVSIEYTTATRWFHTMQEGRLKTYNSRGKLLDELKAVELTLRTGILPNNRTIEGLTQSSFRQPCAEADHLIDPDMGERVLGSLQFASDVMSNDIMKNRDVGLPPYNKYRKLCGLPVAKEFDDLLHWMPEEQVDGIRMSYETVEDVDLMVGIMSEKPMKGAATGPTLACIIADQMVYWRRADRFWYENNVHPGSFTEEQLYQIRHMTMARLLCDHGDEVDSVQPWTFFVAGHGNEITDCKNILAPSLAPWLDQTCKLHQKERKTTYFSKRHDML